MTLGKAVNDAQSAIWHWPLPWLFKGFLIIFCEFFYTTFNYFDRSVPDARIRVERYVAEGRTTNEASVDKLRVAIVTGANRGLGYEATKAMGQAGYRVIMACRNREATEAAIARLKQETGLDDDAFEFMQLDLSSFRSIDAFVHEIKARNLPVHRLLANAAVFMLPKYTETEDGVETQFGVNYLGHFQLITSLLDVVKKSAPARIVIYAAIGNHTVDKIDYEYLLDKHKYMPYRSCAYSEVANVSFANQLADELKNTGVTVNSLSPGMASTGIIRHFPMQGLVNFISRHTCLTPLEGAATAIYLLLSSDVESVTGRYWAHEVIQEPNPNTLDRREQEKLRVFTENFIADIKSKQAASTPSSS